MRTVLPESDTPVASEILSSFQPRAESSDSAGAEEYALELHPFVQALVPELERLARRPGQHVEVAHVVVGPRDPRRVAGDADFDVRRRIVGLRAAPPEHGGVAVHQRPAGRVVRRAAGEMDGVLLDQDAHRRLIRLDVLLLPAPGAAVRLRP